MRADGKIDFVEFEGADLAEVKRFYKAAFGWNFHGDDTEDAAFAAGESEDEAANDHEPPAPPLVVIYAEQLSVTWRKVRAAGAEITRPIFWVPNGWRFQFRDPAGNELAVWSRVWSQTGPKDGRESIAEPAGATAEWCEGNQLDAANQWDVLVA